jgi:MoxR-like ATPase
MKPLFSNAMGYRKTFDPKRTQTFVEPSIVMPVEGRERSIYVYTDEIVLAVNVALATGRPLLVRGPSGCGKSTLARNVACTLGWRYYEHVISSRTQAHDLLWQVDLLRRLQDAQAGELAPDLMPYVLPNVLWWAFDQHSARKQLARSGSGDALVDELGEGDSEQRAVVLLDEIDKADPDVPNNLLVPLGSLTFLVEETREQVQASKPPLVFLTTNDERDLPPAFVRRCVELKIASPTPDQLITIGKAHFGAISYDLLAKVAALFDLPDGSSNPPSTAEYLDTVQACLDLDVKPGSPLFENLARVTIWKHGRTRAQGANS